MEGIVEGLLDVIRRVSLTVPTAQPGHCIVETDPLQSWALLASPNTHT